MQSERSVMLSPFWLVPLDRWQDGDKAVEKTSHLAMEIRHA